MLSVSNIPRLRAASFVGKARGASQSHLIEAEDGDDYFVKFSNNPNGQRSIISEFIANRLLRHLDLSVPEAALIELDTAFINENPSIYMAFKSSQCRPQPGLHFGSRLSIPKEVGATFDFLPDSLLPAVANLQEFLGILVFDSWVANNDKRQCVFVRDSTDPSKFRIEWIDNDRVFGGTDWRFKSAFRQSLYFRSCVYQGVRNLSDFNRWMSRIKRIDGEWLNSLVEQVPEEWAIGENDALTELTATLLRRALRIEDIVANGIEGSPDYFPLCGVACREPSFAVTAAFSSA